MKILVDADIIVYRAAFGAETVSDFGDFVSVTGDKQNCLGRMLADVDAYRQRFGGEVIMALSDEAHCFREDVLPTYKGDRTRPFHGCPRRPVLWGAAREMIAENFSVEQWANLEADDVLGILGTRYEDSVIVTVDKDLKTVPARQWNPETDVELTPTLEEANRFHLLQTLMGDRTDNYFGIPGIGEKRAEKILDSDVLGPIWEDVVGAYKAAGLTEADALTQARCAYILRDGDYNQETGEVTLWTPS